VSDLALISVTRATVPGTMTSLDCGLDRTILGLSNSCRYTSRKALV
jgi:hypothetical protein